MCEASVSRIVLAVGECQIRTSGQVRDGQDKQSKEEGVVCVNFVTHPRSYPATSVRHLEKIWKYQGK